MVTTRAYSAGDDTYQTFFEILQNASCYQKFSQNARSYSHDYEAHSITPCALQTMPARTCFSPSIQTGLPGKRKIRLPPLPRWKRGGDLPAAAGCGGVKNVVRSPDAADQRPRQNKNRGTQVVKLVSRFCFHLCAHAVPEPWQPRGCSRANQNAASCRRKEKGMEMERSACRRSVFWCNVVRISCQPPLREQDTTDG